MIIPKNCKINEVLANIMLNLAELKSSLSMLGGAAIVGEVRMWAGAGELPRGWLLADGSYVSRSSYAGLFEVIGTQFGEGDGSTTFQLPGFVGRFPLGVNTVGMLGLKGGSSEVTLTVDQIPSHSHLVFGNTVGYSGSVVRAPVLNSGPSNVSTGESGGDQPHSNMPPYIGVYFIIYAGE